MPKLTPEQRKAIHRAERTLKRRETHDIARRKLHQEREDARAQILEFCTHPEEWRRAYKWEHDNGYGRQHMREGIRCGLCLAEQAFPGPYASWHLPDCYAVKL
jgi:hypothetical protein